MDDQLIANARRAVALIPEGRVVSYGDLAELIGTTPRIAGRLLRLHSDGVPWWRVTTASGDLSVLDKARPMWAAEGIEIKPNGLGCRMSEYRADLMSWATRYDAGVTHDTSR